MANCSSLSVADAALAEGGTCHMDDGRPQLYKNSELEKKRKTKKKEEYEIKCPEHI